MYKAQNDHSFEEIRNAAIVALKALPVDQYANLEVAIAQHFQKTEGKQSAQYGGYEVRLSKHDEDLFLEVFWSLFREGVITLGMDSANRNFPWFRVSQWGRKFLSNQSPYFFTDVTDYERQLRKSVPEIDAVTMLYVQEAVQTFKIGALLASSVMVGVAAEHTFNLLVDTVEDNSAYNTSFEKVYKQSRILLRLNEFKKVLDANPAFLTADIKEDLDTRFLGIISLIRTFRNEAGHPTGNIIDREQAYVNLQLFIPYAQKLYQMIKHFK